MEILPLTKDLIADAGAIYACSWQTAYKGIIPQAYLEMCIRDSAPTVGWCSADPEVIRPQIVRPQRFRVLTPGEKFVVFSLPQTTCYQSVATRPL